MKPLILAAALACAPLSLAAESYPEAHNIITIGGPVTETVFALGEGDRVVARDTTSLYPEEVNALPDVGYMRQLSAEGVLSLGPDLIITRETVLDIEHCLHCGGTMKINAAILQRAAIAKILGHLSPERQK